jgi:hypothetical protein
MSISCLTIAPYILWYILKFIYLTPYNSERKERVKTDLIINELIAIVAVAAGAIGGYFFDKIDKLSN